MSESPSFTRADYMANRCTHRQYYGQFVNAEVINHLLRHIPLEKILASKDPHLNDIPLRLWDNATGAPIIGHQKWGAPIRFLRAEGTDTSLAGAVCILKEAAKQLQEREREKPSYEPPKKKLCHCGFVGLPAEFESHLAKRKADYEAYQWTGFDAHHHEVERES